MTEENREAAAVVLQQYSKGEISNEAAKKQLIKLGAYPDEAEENLHIMDGGSDVVMKEGGSDE